MLRSSLIKFFIYFNRRANSVRLTYMFKRTVAAVCTVKCNRIFLFKQSGLSPSNNAFNFRFGVTARLVERLTKNGLIR